MTSGWAVPPFPFPRPEDHPADPPLVEVEEAFLTRCSRGDLRTVQTPTRWLRGAVHDAEGRLVVASQKVGGLGGNQAAMADPGRVPVKDRARRLEGTWLYGGHWIQHFGHFFTETVTTLWPHVTGRLVDEDVAGVVFHSYMSVFRGVEPWQTELVALAGLGDLPVEIIENKPLRVERLLVPGRSVVVNGWAHEEARAVWRRMVEGTGVATSLPPGGGERVFVSRTAFNAERRDRGRPVRTDAERDAGLDRVFARAGFRVVVPEALSVADQVRLAAGASVLAGVAGTALHLSAFSPPGCRVVEIGDTRSPTWQVPMQQVVDHVAEHPTAFVPHTASLDDVAGLLADLPA